MDNLHEIWTQITTIQDGATEPRIEIRVAAAI